MSCILFLILLSNYFGQLVNCENQSRGISSSTFNSKIIWLSQSFMEAELLFQIDEEASKLCQQDFYRLRQHLSNNQTSWAVRMFESSEWPRVGLLSGKKYHLGNWGECFDADAGNFKGQYCLVEAKFDFSNLEKLRMVSEELSAWNDLQKYHTDPNQLVHLQNIYWAMCVPSSCQPLDLKLSVRNTVNRIFDNYDVTVSVNVDPKMCSTKTDEKLPLSFYFTSSFFVIWFLVVMYATFWNKREKKCTEQWGLHFCSLSHNLKKLTEHSSGVYPIFYCINGTVSLFIIFLHRVYFYLGFPQFSAAGVNMLPAQFSQLVFGNILDFNFAISGYLLCHQYKQKFSTSDVSNVISFLIFRWLRKISVLLTMLPIVTFISPHLSNGPLFRYFMSFQTDACKETWWAVILAMNNFNTSDNMCLLHTWFTSVELQLTIIGTILLFITGTHTKLGHLTTFLFFIIATIIVFQTNFQYEFPAIFKVPFSQINFMFTHPNGRLTYMRPYTRLGPYLMGFLTASIVQDLKSREFKFSYSKKMFIIIVSSIIAYKTYIYGCSLHTSDVIKNALYASFYRSILMLPFSCFLCIFFTSGFGAFNKIFENKIFVIYGRLLNCIYIIGPLLQFFQVISQETFVTPSLLMLFWLAAGDFIVTLLLAIPAHLFLEAPMLNILRNLYKQMIK